MGVRHYGSIEVHAVGSASLAGRVCATSAKRRPRPLTLRSVRACRCFFIPMGSANYDSEATRYDKDVQASKRDDLLARMDAHLRPTYHALLKALGLY